MVILVVLKVLGKETGEIEIRKRIEAIQTTALLKSAWIFRRVQEKTTIVKNSQRVKNKKINND